MKLGRLELIVNLALGVLSVSLAAGAQPARMSRVGFLSVRSRSDPQTQLQLDALRQGLRELGYVEGQTVVIEYRGAEGRYERLPDLAAELVRLKVDVIVAPGILPTQAAKQTTKAIPIVMLGVSDPIAGGLFTSIARPGGNITGLSLIAPELVGKQLQLLREVVPKVSRVAVLWNPANPGNAPQLREAEVAAQAWGVRLQPLGAHGPSEIDRAFVAMTRERAGALLVLSDSMLNIERKRIADLAAKSRLPTVSGFAMHAEAGGLMAYGTNLLDQFRRAATYVDRILKGAKPADLPVESNGAPVATTSHVSST